MPGDLEPERKRRSESERPAGPDASADRTRSGRVRIELVDALADLARLELGRDEAAQLGRQVETILGYIRSLQAVEVEGVPEYLTAQQPGSGLRADEVELDGLDPDRALASVPVLRDRLVAVPKFKD